MQVFRSEFLKFLILEILNFLPLGQHEADLIRLKQKWPLVAGERI